MMKQHSYRSTWADVNLENVKKNVTTFIKRLNKPTQLMAVVKADGYGHGAVEIANVALEAGATYLGVAVLEEALELRESGIRAPILLLSPIEKEAVLPAVMHEISLTVFTSEITEEVVRIAKETGKSPRIHLKIDTGMGRVGVRTLEEVMSLLHILKEGGLKPEGIYTHFAEAENLASPAFTREQFKKFMNIVHSLQEKGIEIPLRHCCNTAGTMSYPDMHLDMVRVGIGLYGLYPDRVLSKKLPLYPVMTLKTKILYLKEIDENETVGYGRTYRASTNRKIATVPVGYADGYPRQLSNKGEASIQQTNVPIAGLVCMDQTMFDVTGLPSLQLNEEVVLFGNPEKGEVSAYDLADWADTSHYEIVAALGKRIPRIYVNRPLPYK